MRALLAAVALLSAATIAYEILLTRLFSIILWHHFAYMIISVALLGVGASGTVLTYFKDRLAARLHVSFAAAALAFSLSAIAGFLLAERIPFNPLEVIWDPRQQLYLLQVYLLLSVPFFASALAIGLVLSAAGDEIPGVYRADMVGAGFGSLVIVGLLFLMLPQEALRAAGLLGLAAAFLAASGDKRIVRPAGVIVLAVGLAILLLPSSVFKLIPSPYKSLSTTLTIPDAKVIEERSSPLGLLTVVESPAVPFRHAPGVGLTTRLQPPEQLGLFTDADGMTAINRFDGDLSAFAYLDQTTGALPFHLLEKPETLVLGAGAGSDILLALYHGVPLVDAVELNPQIVGLMRDTYGVFAGGLYERSDVRIHVAEGRTFVAASKRKWDLIHVALLDSYSGASAGVQALAESPLYTVEALRAMLGRLNPGGMLSITRWLRAPPRDNLKLLATVAAALEDIRVSPIASRVAVIRGWSTVTVVVKNGMLTGQDVAQVRNFTDERGFDVAWLPNMQANEANQVNQLERAYFFEATQSLFGPERERYIDAYKFHIDAATDNKPYFYRSFRWALLPELGRQKNRATLTLLDSGYLVLLATLGQTIIAGLVLILLPLLWLKSEIDDGRKLGKWAVALYFLALGFGFMFIEMAYIGRLSLFLGHPLSAIAVVLVGFLVFAGLGAGLVGGLNADGQRSAMKRGFSALIIVAMGETVGLTYLLPALAELGLAAKVLVSLVAIAPLALAMGIPFPLGLARVARAAPSLVPWAWAINGCASVTGVVVASLLAMHVGFSGVVTAAVGLYAVAGFTFLRRSSVSA